MAEPTMEATEEGDAAMPVSAYASTTNAALTRRGLSHLRSLEGQGVSADPSARYLTLHTPGIPSSSSPAPSASRLTVNVPRLRRGGIRAPESFPVAGDGYAHSVRISSPPIPGLMTAQEHEERNRRSVSVPDGNPEHSFRAGSPVRVWRPRSRSPSSAAGEGTPGPSGEPATLTNLPTPRSISPEDSPSQQN